MLQKQQGSCGQAGASVGLSLTPSQLDPLTQHLRGHPRTSAGLWQRPGGSIWLARGFDNPTAFVTHTSGPFREHSCQVFEHFKV